MNTKHVFDNNLIASGCLLASLLAFGYGYLTEWKQSRAEGPVAIVATLPFGVAAGVLLTFALLWSTISAGFYWYPLTLIGSILVFGCLILSANGRPRVG